MSTLGVSRRPRRVAHLADSIVVVGVLVVLCAVAVVSCRSPERPDSPPDGSASAGASAQFCQRFADLSVQLARLQAQQAQDYWEIHAGEGTAAAEAAQAEVLATLLAGYEELSDLAPAEVRDDMAKLRDIAREGSPEGLYGEAAAGPSERIQAWQRDHCPEPAMPTDEAGCRLEDVPTAGNRTVYFFSDVHEARTATISNPVADPLGCAYRQLCGAMRASVTEDAFRSTRGEALSALLTADSYSGARSDSGRYDVGVDVERPDEDTLDPAVTTTWTDGHFTWDAQPDEHTAGTVEPHTERWRIDLVREGGGWKVCGFTKRDGTWGT